MTHVTLPATTSFGSVAINIHKEIETSQTIQKYPNNNKLQLCPILLKQKVSYYQILVYVSYQQDEKIFLAVLVILRNGNTVINISLNLCGTTVMPLTWVVLLLMP
jgi:hypothetical protein